MNYHLIPVRRRRAILVEIVVWLLAMSMTEDTYRNIALVIGTILIAITYTFIAVKAMPVMDVNSRGILIAIPALIGWFIAVSVAVLMFNGSLGAMAFISISSLATTGIVAMNEPHPDVRA